MYGHLVVYLCLWWLGKFVKESDVQLKIVNILSMFKGKYESLFQPEEGLSQFQIVKQRLISSTFVYIH